MQSLHELEKRADRHREEALKKLDEALQQEQQDRTLAEDADRPLVMRKAAVQHQGA